MDSYSFAGLYPKPKLTSCRSKLLPYGSGDALETEGEFEVDVSSLHNVTAKARFVVAPGKFGNLLSYATSVELGLINNINNVSENEPDDFSKYIFGKFPKLFENRLGRIKDVKIKLHIDQSVKPVFQRLRPQPFHLVKTINEAIALMVEQGRISRIYGPTPWLSNIHPVPKPGNPKEIRITIDMRAANTAILRERHPMRRLEDLVVLLNGATTLSTLDMNEAYNQFELDEASQYITGFIAPEGAFKWNVLNLGISSAAEQFQKALEELLCGLAGQTNYLDDIMVWGVSNIEDHDSKLEAVLERLQSRGATLNKRKCQFRRTELEFYGLKFSSKGISISENKLEALNKANPPNTASELVSFLGLASFCERFIKNFAITAEPLRRLTRAKVQWDWGTVEQEAFDKIKNSIFSTVLAYFDLDKRTKVVVDAGPKGIAAVMSQYVPSNPLNEFLITCVSRTLTDVEVRYSQFEKESLAIVWACEKLRTYLIGCEFDLHTDNKAAQTIFSNPHSNPTARVRRLALRMLPFKCRVFYIDGKGNVADYLSRNPIQSNCCEHEKIAEEYIFMVTSASIPSAIPRSELIQATTEDSELNQVVQAVINNRNIKGSIFNQHLKDL